MGRKGRPHKNSKAKAKLIAKIGERDGWKCAICGDNVMKFRIQNHPLAPSLDHIVPVRDGGTYVQNNLRLTHTKCNNEDGVRYDPNYPKERLDAYIQRSSDGSEGNR